LSAATFLICVLEFGLRQSCQASGQPESDCRVPNA
jgi:hypothetical protein